MADKVRVLQTEEEIKIFTDPYRNRIIKAFSESPVPLTVTQTAEIMGEVPANVYYHLKKLLKIDILELDYIKVIKGINAKYYRLTNESYRLSTPVQPASKSAADKQMKRIKDLIYSEVDEFRKEIDSIPQFDPASDIPKGIFGKRDIYLSEDDFKELSNYVNTFMAEKMLKDDSKQKYSVLLGLFIKDGKSSH
jgi:DNA-binding transcriptional ArsR family regulator